MSKILSSIKSFEVDHDYFVSSEGHLFYLKMINGLENVKFNYDIGFEANCIILFGKVEGYSGNCFVKARMNRDESILIVLVPNLNLGYSLEMKHILMEMPKDLELDV